MDLQSVRGRHARSTRFSRRADDLPARRRDGLFVVYELADKSVFALCDITCEQFERRGERLTQNLAPTIREPGA